MLGGEPRCSTTDPLGRHGEDALNANALARACIVLFGAYLVVQSLLLVSNGFVGAQVQLIPLELSASEKLSALGLAVAGGVVAGLLLNVLPGWWLVSRSQALADRLLPSSGEAATYVEFTALLRIGLFLVGCMLTIDGLGGGIGAAVKVALSESVMPEFDYPPLVAPIATLVGGLVLIIWSRRAA